MVKEVRKMFKEGRETQMVIRWRQKHSAYDDRRYHKVSKMIGCSPQNKQ